MEMNEPATPKKLRMHTLVELQQTQEEMLRISQLPKGQQRAALEKMMQVWAPKK
jgi:hypothetical protein